MPTISESVDEADHLFAAQTAAKLLELWLRPAEVHDLRVVEQLIQASGKDAFSTKIDLRLITEMIAETGAILQGHFALLSGLHSDFFFMFSKLGTRAEFRRRIAIELATRFRGANIKSVIAPITAGGLLAQDVADELKANLAFFDVDDHSRPVAVRRGYSLEGLTLIVNDVTTTGEGLGRMLKILAKAGVPSAGIGLIASRGVKGIEIVDELRNNRNRVEVLFHLAIDAFRLFDCAKCRQGLPYVSSGDINR